MDLQLIMEWMEQEADCFKKVEFVEVDAKGAHLFTAVDDEGNKARVKLEADHDKVIVSCQTLDSDQWTIVEILYPGEQ